jgi:hypothetical protein
MVVGDAPPTATVRSVALGGHATVAALEIVAGAGDRVSGSAALGVDDHGQAAAGVVFQLMKIHLLGIFGYACGYKRKVIS